MDDLIGYNRTARAAVDDALDAMLNFRRALHPWVRRSVHGNEPRAHQIRSILWHFGAAEKALGREQRRSAVPSMFESLSHAVAAAEGIHPYTDYAAIPGDVAVAAARLRRAITAVNDAGRVAMQA
jgi:hypothetical protein